MSELDLIFNRKKTKIEEEEKKEEKPSATEIEEKKEVPKEEEKKEVNRVEQKVEDKNNDIQTEIQPIEKTSTNQNLEELMKKFLEKDPKIGVWSYPSYLLLQYLYNTIPGFKMSKVAKDALEKGLKEMYPDLFKVAEKIAKESKKI